MDLYRCLCSQSIPTAGEECSFCSYREAAKVVEGE
jgi:hypothetical protein